MSKLIFMTNWVMRFGIPYFCLPCLQHCSRITLLILGTCLPHGFVFMVTDWTPLHSNICQAHSPICIWCLLKCLSLGKEFPEDDSLGWKSYLHCLFLSYLSQI